VQLVVNRSLELEPEANGSSDGERGVDVRVVDGRCGQFAIGV
jgi:hypothetical protein